MARVSARHEHSVESRHAMEEIVPGREFLRHHGRISIVLLECRVPQPDVEAVLVAKPRHTHEHLDRRKRKMGTVGGVVRPRWDELDAVAAKNRQLANVAPTASGPSHRRNWSWAGSQADAPGSDIWCGIELPSRPNLNLARFHAQFAKAGPRQREHHVHRRPLPPRRALRHPYGYETPRGRAVACPFFRSIC